MPESAPVVDIKALHAALDAARAERDWSWRQLAKELNVSPSTISRMANGLRPDLSAFAAMTSWLKMSAEDFYRPTTTVAEDDEPALVAQLAPLLRARRDLEDRDVQHLEQLIGAAVQRFRAERNEG